MPEPEAHHLDELEELDARIADLLSDIEDECARIEESHEPVKPAGPTIETLIAQGAALTDDGADDNSADDSADQGADEVAGVVEPEPKPEPEHEHADADADETPTLDDDIIDDFEAGFDDASPELPEPSASTTDAASASDTEELDELLESAITEAEQVAGEDPVEDSEAGLQAAPQSETQTATLDQEELVALGEDAEADTADPADGTSEAAAAADDKRDDADEADDIGTDAVSASLDAVEDLDRSLAALTEELLDEDNWGDPTAGRPVEDAAEQPASERTPEDAAPQAREPEPANAAAPPPAPTDAGDDAPMQYPATGDGPPVTQAASEPAPKPAPEPRPAATPAEPPAVAASADPPAASPAISTDPSDEQSTPEDPAPGAAWARARARASEAIAQTREGWPEQKPGKRAKLAGAGALGLLHAAWILLEPVRRAAGPAGARIATDARAAAGPAALTLAGLISKPLAGRPALSKAAGYLAGYTFFLAFCVLMWALFFRAPDAPVSGTTPTKLSAEPALAD
ncbi:MAG: hypothetical protein AAF356_05710 [Planctomycetota bacterium]